MVYKLTTWQIDNYLKKHKYRVSFPHESYDTYIREQQTIRNKYIEDMKNLDKKFEETKPLWEKVDNYYSKKILQNFICMFVIIIMTMIVSVSFHLSPMAMPFITTIAIASFWYNIYKLSGAKDK